MQANPIGWVTKSGAPSFFSCSKSGDTNIHTYIKYLRYREQGRYRYRYDIHIYLHLFKYLFIYSSNSSTHLLNHLLIYHLSPLSSVSIRLTNTSETTTILYPRYNTYLPYYPSYIRFTLMRYLQYLANTTKPANQSPINCHTRYPSWGPSIAPRQSFRILRNPHTCIIHNAGR